jgi:hypothetical protein
MLVDTRKMLIPASRNMTASESEKQFSVGNHRETRAWRFDGDVNAEHGATLLWLSYPSRAAFTGCRAFPDSFGDWYIRVIARVFDLAQGARHSVCASNTNRQAARAPLGGAAIYRRSRFSYHTPMRAPSAVGNFPMPA